MFDRQVVSLSLKKSFQYFGEHIVGRHHVEQCHRRLELGGVYASENAMDVLARVLQKLTAYFPESCSKNLIVKVCPSSSRQLMP